MVHSFNGNLHVRNFKNGEGNYVSLKNWAKDGEWMSNLLQGASKIESAGLARMGTMDVGSVPSTVHMPGVAMRTSER